jgi:hypothetical protein
MANGGAHTAVEVALVDGADGEKDIKLRSVVWGDGLGWYRQQTLTLDSNDITALMRALGTAQARLRPLPAKAPAQPLTPLRRVDPPARVEIAPPAAPTGLKATCCKRYERKGRACKRCPQRAR